MEGRLLNIKWFLVLLTIAYTNGEETVNSKKERSPMDPIRMAVIKMGMNQNYYKEEMAKYREEHGKSIDTLTVVNKYSVKLEKIKSFLKYIIEDIEESLAILTAVDCCHSIDLLPTDEDILNCLLSVLEKTAYFGDIFYNFPVITERILRIEKGWSDVINISLKYASSMKDFLDDSTNTKIYVVIETLRSHDNVRNQRVEL